MSVASPCTIVSQSSDSTTSKSGSTWHKAARMSTIHVQPVFAFGPLRSKKRWPLTSWHSMMSGSGRGNSWSSMRKCTLSTSVLAMSDFAAVSICSYTLRVPQ